MADRGFPYVLIRLLGQGATSRVWAAQDATGREVAIKVGLPAHATDLTNEAERLLHAGSPALTAVLDAGRVPAGVEALADSVGGVYIVLERAPGDALDVHALTVRERQQLALVVARDVGEALADLHASGFAHGDVKPANIVVERARRVLRARLVDLGLATRAEETSVRGGTRRYLAPESLAPDSLGDARARDLFALGIVLSEIASADIAASSRPAEGASDATVPAELRPIINALLARAPGARPSASWVRRQALGLLAEEDSPSRRSERGRRSVERAYLAVRRREITHAAARRAPELTLTGAPAEWLGAALSLAGKLARLRGEPSGEAPEKIGDLAAFGRARWLVALVGAAAARWPPLLVESDAELAERLLSLAERSEPAAFTLVELETGVSSRNPIPTDTVGIALALGAGASDPRLLDAAERALRETESTALGVALGRALCLRGELGRALAVLAVTTAPEAEAEAAEVLRRSGDAELAEARAEAVLQADCGVAAKVRAAATLGRIALDRGDAELAKQRVSSCEAAASTLEVQALSCLHLGQRGEALDWVEQGLAIVQRPDERARLEAVRGGIFHASGEAQRASACFRAAVEQAQRSGAVLEEATYLTGFAAAATNVGELWEALESAERAVLLFEHLGRPREAARAALARTAAYSQAGSVAETLDAAQDAFARARAADDRRCRAYVHLAVADVLPASDSNAGEHADRALALSDGADADDQLRIAARRLSLGRELDLAALDTLARDPARAVDASVEWWGARARYEARSERPTRADAILAELTHLVASAVPTGVRGPAFSAAARLAQRVADGDRARRFLVIARHAAAELLEHAPRALVEAVRGLWWVAELPQLSEPAVSSEQVTHVVALVHALGRRDRLRPLLDQVLDALILWTGVERGLLLMRAPGGKLVPRAARNLAKHDLSAGQLALSTTLAERALRNAEPVVAVDAAGELPELHVSVHALKLRSVLAVPLLARGEAIGVVYLDDRIRRGAFGPSELAWVRLLAALASVAIADARDQLLLRRAVRRARRAEARLADDLALREAALDVAETELAKSRGARETRFEYERIVGESDVLGALLRTLDRVSLSDVPVLIVGESGSGKELVARAIHDHSARARARFVGENCGAIPEPLLESTLFGHVRGAFTGASRARSGLFEIADGGTLFLDEIAEMSLGMQTKLLRVLEDGEVHALGSERSRKVDVRIIGATHRDLDARVSAGLFRQDLLYRLNVIQLVVPPLRERRGDIPILVRHFLAKHGGERSPRVSREAMERLVGFAWPGNIRQLENEIRRALVLSDDVIDVAQLSPDVSQGAHGVVMPENELELRARVDQLERELCEKALAKTGGNQTRAAELLGLSRFGLQKMLKRLGIGSGSKPGRRPTAALGKQR
ncbi:MAG: sigma 54-interacting transcriptional regulator [Myxococcales bacterium]|nr:sigma 54-interacting transcriptional regulator [Myxococcales bacterium]